MEARDSFCFPKNTKNPNPSPIEKRFGFSILAVVLPVDIPTRWEPRTNKSPTGAFVAPPQVGPYGLRLLIFPQPFGRALKNQNAAPTTPPCFCHRQRSSSLHCGFACGAVRRRPVRAPSIVQTKRKTRTRMCSGFSWCDGRDSNPRPTDS